jgi:hypothetical protein
MELVSIIIAAFAGALLIANGVGIVGWPIVIFCVIALILAVT